MVVDTAIAHLERMYVSWEQSDTELCAYKRGKIEAVFPVKNGHVCQSFFRYVCRTKNWTY